MVRLTGEDATRQLKAWWAKVQQSLFPRQHIIHILKPFEDNTFRWRPSYRRWCVGDDDARAASLALLAEDAGMTPYLLDANMATCNGVRLTRIFLVRREEYADRTSIQRYAAEVHYPFFAAETGETIFMLFQSDYEEAGFPVRTADVNIWGVAGIIRTGYRGNEVAWREFLPWWRNPWQTFAEQRFVRRVARLARERGVPIGPADSS